MLLICVNTLLILVAMAFQRGAEPSLSTVRAADLAVYSTNSLDSRVVKTLHRGDRVFVLMEITSGEAWCWIRETDQAKPSGYVLCTQLDRPPKSDQKRWGLSSPQPSSVADEVSPPKKPDVESPATKSDDRRSLRDPALWEDRFKFSDQQRRRSAELQGEARLAACQDRVERMYRANGISDVGSMLKALGGMGRSVSGMARAGALGAELDRCGAKYGSFWKKFVALMDPQQKSQLGKEPYFILFWAQTQSDPSVEFGFYVLSQMSSQ